MDFYTLKHTKLESVPAPLFHMNDIKFKNACIFLKI